MSDKNKDIHLTDEEQEQIKAETPELLEAIESDSPTARAWLASWRAKKESPATNQKPATPKSNNSDIVVGKGDMSMVDLRMENFKAANSKLAKNKSQLPNLAVQAKIFPPTKKGRRPVFNWKEIESGREDIKIFQRGEQLNQLDLTGWLMLIKYAKGPDMIAEFTRYEFLKLMRKHDSSRDYKWLRALLSRLGFAQFNIYLQDSQGKSWTRYEGALAPQNIETSDGKFAVQLSKPLYAMLGFDGWSFINIEQRLELGQNQWAQAFHAYLSTHKCPANGFWWTKEGLRKEWGPGYKDYRNFLDKFKRKVLKPLHDIDFIKKVIEKDTAFGIWW